MRAVELRNPVEVFFMDCLLPQPMELPIQILQHAVDVLLGALHGPESACVLAGEGLSPGPEEEYKVISAEHGLER